MRGPLLLAIGALLLAPLHAEDIWLEGESPAHTDIKPHPWYSGAVNKTLLSGGDFLANFSPQEGHADYQFDVKNAGSYTFWLRANPIGAPLLDYQLNGGAWKPVDFSHPTDVENIAIDNKPDLRFIAWMNLGPVDLTAGANTIAFRFHSANNNHGSIDCFLFTQSPFVPSGKAKPGQKLGTDEAGWFSFEPKPETFAPDALLDLRSLNEKEAGESGFIDASGDQFKLGNGKPVRFWGLNVSLGDNLTHADIDYMAARFAKMGINLVRLFLGSLVAKNGTDPTHIDLQRLDTVFYAVNAFKKQGIYTHLTPYYVLDFPLKPGNGIPGTDDALGRQPFGLLIFEPHFQDIYQAWLKQFLTTPDPYNGATLAQEPAVAIFEIQNEDSLFFWSFDPAKCGKGPRELLEELFGNWLISKYGTVDKASSAWPTAKLPDDHTEVDPDGPHSAVAFTRMGLYAPWMMSNQGFGKQTPDVQKRLLDQIHFYADTQRKFYATVHGWLREDLGAKWPISASNWITVPGLDFIERYTYSPVEVIDRHGYFGGKHTGTASAWSVRAGQYYEEKTAMYDPTSVCFQYVRLPGHPHIQSEIAWNKPNRFIAEAAPLISAYESLQGVDGVENFVADDGNWANNGGSNWPYMMPGEIGQSPAEALQYRRGDLKPGDTVAREITSVDDLLKLKDAGLLTEGKSADFHAVQISGEGAIADPFASFDPLAFFVGRVEHALDPNAQPIATDLAKYVDREKKIVTSTTGEITWDYANGLLTINAPTSQAAAGFLAKSGPIKLNDVTIESNNEYGTIHLISLDGAPLATSKKILVQAFTEEKMEGFRANNGTIADIGHPPIIVRNIDAKITLSGNTTNLKATALDEQGYPRESLTPQLNGNSAITILPKDTLYTLITRP